MLTLTGCCFSYWGGHGNNLTCEVFLWSLITVTLHGWSHSNTWTHSCILYLSPCLYFSFLFSFYSRFSQCPHCGLAAGGATTLSAISSQVLIWPLMGLDELGASLYREREIHRTGRVERTSLLSLIRFTFLQCTFLPVSPQLSLHHSNW